MNFGSPGSCQDVITITPHDGCIAEVLFPVNETSDQ